MLSYDYEGKHIIISITQTRISYVFNEYIGESSLHIFNTNIIHMDDTYLKMKYLIKKQKTLHY